MSPYSITRENAARDLEALKAILDDDGIVEGDVKVLEEIADLIKEQVKPEEPKEWGSIVYGRTCGVDPCHWQRDADGNWRSERGALTEHWSHFRTGVEVLRIGVGAEYNHPLQQLRDILFRSPDGEMTNREAAEAYKALRREIGILLASQTDEGAGALPGPISPGPGVAAPSSPDTHESYMQGRQDTARYLRKQLIQLRSSAITAERQDTYDKAIEAVEALS